MTGKLPSVKLPPWSENCPPWNCPTEDSPPTNPAPWIWVRVWTMARVKGGGGQSYSRQFFMYRIKCPKAIAGFPFCDAECINLTISQQQLQLFINSSNFFRRRILNICTCKGDFWKSYFLQRGALSEYL